mgnify:CR=1 FL=1|tara:strand:+ start:512 stop:1804 length:1293 start_codon:yes stop_codon:yes gene_type:complete
MAARNIQPNTDDVDDPGNTPMVRAWEALTSKVRYLMPRAAASWKPEFQSVLNSAHSMRIEKIAMAKKSQIRGCTGVCMACGREERNCTYSMDLVGPFEPKAWLKGIDRISPEYATFISKYEETFEDEFLECATRSGVLPDIDMGTYVLGETCLRKAKLVYLLQTTVMELCYAAERKMEVFSRSEEDGGNVELGEHYTVTDEAATDLVQKQDAIEFAIADEKRPVPEIETDESLWEVIDEARKIASRDDPARFTRLVRDRAYKMLRTRKRTLSEEEEEEEDDDDDERNEDWGSKCADDADDADDAPRHTARRRRVCVIRDSDSDDDTQGAHGAHGAHGACSSSSSAGMSFNQLLPRRLSSRVPPPPPASGMASMQRAAGNLPSRRATLVSIMELQIRLARQEKHDDAAVCTNAIQTLQELMRRVEELAHSV